MTYDHLLCAIALIVYAGTAWLVVCAHTEAR